MRSASGNTSVVWLIINQTANLGECLLLANCLFCSGVARLKFRRANLAVLRRITCFESFFCCSFGFGLVTAATSSTLAGSTAASAAHDILVESFSLRLISTILWFLGVCSTLVTIFVFCICSSVCVCAIFYRTSTIILSAFTTITSCVSGIINWCVCFNLWQPTSFCLEFQTYFWPFRFIQPWAICVIFEGSFAMLISGICSTRLNGLCEFCQAHFTAGSFSIPQFITLFLWGVSASFHLVNIFAISKWIQKTIPFWKCKSSRSGVIAFEGFWRVVVITGTCSRSVYTSAYFLTFCFEACWKLSTVKFFVATDGITFHEFVFFGYYCRLWFWCWCWWWWFFFFFLFAVTTTATIAGTTTTDAAHFSLVEVLSLRFICTILWLFLVCGTSVAIFVYCFWIGVCVWAFCIRAITATFFTNLWLPVTFSLEFQAYFCPLRFWHWWFAFCVFFEGCFIMIIDEIISERLNSLWEFHQAHSTTGRFIPQGCALSFWSFTHIWLPISMKLSAESQPFFIAESIIVSFVCIEGFSDLFWLPLFHVCVRFFNIFFEFSPTHLFIVTCPIEFIRALL